MAVGRLRIENCSEGETARREKNEEQEEKRSEVKWLDFKSLINQQETSSIYTTYHIT